MTFDFVRFAKSIHNEFSTDFDLQQVDELLKLDENAYQFDSPVSTGKRLVVDHISFFGKKSDKLTTEHAGDTINFTHSFSKGVNMIVADNLRGKSSLFKLVKFALTGSDSIKSDVKKWIDHVFVNFSINDKHFTSYLNLSGSRLNAFLYNGTYRQIVEIKELTNELIIETVGAISFSKSMNEFFFKQFSYYSLKWTQHISSKDSTELKPVGTSWKGYFKTVFLESKDSRELMYGGQGKLVFQMLLGIELTYPINRLKVKRDLIQNEKGKIINLNKHNQNKGKKDKSELELRLVEINKALAQIEENNSKHFDLTPLYDRYEMITKAIEEENKKTWEAQRSFDFVQRRMNEISNQGQNAKKEKERVHKELHKSIRQRDDIKEYLEIGILFSNLDIKYCPSCNKNVTEKVKVQKNNTGTCSLCDQGIEHTHEEDQQSFQDKLTNLEIIIERLTGDISRLESEIKELSSAYRQFKKDREHAKRRIPSSEVLSKHRVEINKLEKTIKEHRKKTPVTDKRKDALIEKRAVIKYKLNEAKKGQIIDTEIYDKQIKLLSYAIYKLNKEQITQGKRIINKLTNLMLEELKALGLDTIKEVQIKENFEISYKQNGEFISFDNIAEGEQLRAKIALYLSLMQLDIEFNFGRHTRLLIIDSPGKEEGDENYLSGLTSVLREIEERFGDQLQIIIGTAERKLEGAVDPNKQLSFAPKTYVF